MAWTPYQAVLAIIMVVTGSINTLSTSWADRLEARHKCVDSNNYCDKGKFDHPFFQAIFMFFGEFLCLVAFKLLYFYYKRRQDGSIYENDLVKGNQDFNPLIFLPAAMFDMIGTSVMYLGLTMTYPSSLQMLRGAVIIFVALLSIMFLRRRLLIKQWVGIVLIIGGLAIVGVSDVLYPSTNANNDYTTKGILTGDLLIILAQIFTAIQMVYEEKFVAGKDIPALQAVGWEGIFGMLVLGILLIPAYYLHVPWKVGNPRSVLEDVPDAIYMLGDNYLIIIASVGTIISIAFFNFAGISVTKEISATTRMILDSIRTIFIWVASLGLKWQEFEWLQVPGILILFLGMCIYNGLIPSWSRFSSLCGRNEEREVLTTAESTSNKRDEES